MKQGNISSPKVLEKVPPTQDALKQHTLRASHQARHVWSHCLTPVPTYPDPSVWGWKRNGASYILIWKLLPDASATCCGCLKGSTTMCKCRLQCASAGIVTWTVQTCVNACMTTCKLWSNGFRQWPFWNSKWPSTEYSDDLKYYSNVFLVSEYVTLEPLLMQISQWRPNLWINRYLATAILKFKMAMTRLF